MFFKRNTLMTTNFPYIVPSAKFGSGMLFGDIHIGHRWARHNLAIALLYHAVLYIWILLLLQQQLYFLLDRA